MRSFFLKYNMNSHTGHIFRINFGTLCHNLTLKKRNKKKAHFNIQVHKAIDFYFQERRISNICVITVANLYNFKIWIEPNILYIYISTSWDKDSFFLTYKHIYSNNFLMQKSFVCNIHNLYWKKFNTYKICV